MTSSTTSWKLTDGLVVVTGAGGFIGSHLVEKLASRGTRVRALVHYNAQGTTGALRFVEPSLLETVEIIRGDVQDPYAVRSLLRGAHAAFHLAALIGIPYSYVAPASYVATNIGGTLNVLAGAPAEGLARVIVTSTRGT